MRNSFVKFSGKENAYPSKETIAEMRAKFRQQPLSIDVPFNPLVEQNQGYNSSKNASGPTKPELPTVSMSTKAQRARHFALYLSSSKLIDYQNPPSQSHKNVDGVLVSRKTGLRNSAHNFGDIGGLVKSSQGGLTDGSQVAKFAKTNRSEFKSNKTLIASPVHQIIKHGSFTIPPKYAVNFSEIGGPTTSLESEKRISKNFEKKTEPQTEYDSLACSFIHQTDSQENILIVKDKGTPSKQRVVNGSPSYETPDFPMRHKYVIESFGKKLDCVFESMQAEAKSDSNWLNKNQLGMLLRVMGVEEEATQDQQTNDFETDALLKIIMHGLKTEGDDEISYPILRLFLTTVYALQRQRVWGKLNLNSEGRTYNSPQARRRVSIAQFSNKFYSFSKNTSIPTNPSLFNRNEGQQVQTATSADKNTEETLEQNPTAKTLNKEQKESSGQSILQKPSSSVQQLPILYSEKPAFSLQQLPTLDLYSSYIEGQTSMDSPKKQTMSLSNHSSYKLLRQQKLLHKNQKSGLYLDGDLGSQKSLSRQSRFQMTDSLLVYDITSDTIPVESSFDFGKNKPLSITKICRTLCEFHDNKAKTAVNQDRGEYLYCVVMKFTNGRKHLPVHSNDSPQKIMASFLQKYSLDKSSKAHLQCYLANDPKTRVRS